MAPPLVKVSEADELTLKVCAKLRALYQAQPADNRSKKPLLILLSRFADLSTMVYHSWTYLSLLQDLFNIKHNTFQFKEDAKAPVKNYSLDFESDMILSENAFLGFHEAGQNVDTALQNWTAQYQQINQ